MTLRPGPMMIALAAVSAAVPAAWPAGSATALVAQDVDLDESRLLGDAAAREMAGDAAGAESLLHSILAHRPASVPALLALERVLRSADDLEGLLPPVRVALEHEPESPLLNQLLLRTLAALEREDELETAGRAWIGAAPDVEIPYRDVARAWQALEQPERARAALEEGRQRVDRPDALALELGDLYAGTGAPDRALREWSRAIGPDARGLLQVRRRLRALPDGGASLLGQLVDVLTAEPRTDERLAAAVEVAVDAGLEERARQVASELLPRVPGDERSRFLSRVARQAEGARLHGLAYWAYDALLATETVRSAGGSAARDVQEGGRELAIRERLAELALVIGDTAAARAGFETVEEGHTAGSAERRQAAAHRIALSAEREPERAAGALAAFLAEYPDAPEHDRLAAAVAAALAGRGRGEEAARVLAGVRGPRTSVLRGRLALERGEIATARTAYLAAAAALRGPEATAVLERARLLGRLSAHAAVALGEALGFQDRGEPGLAVDALAAAIPELSPADRPPLLELAAELAAEAGLTEDAIEIRRRLVAEHPRSNEAPTALLALARALRSRTGGEIEARELLERLIIEYPSSALVPQARRELDALGRSGVAGIGTSNSR